MQYQCEVVLAKVFTFRKEQCSPPGSTGTTPVNQGSLSQTAFKVSTVQALPVKCLYSRNGPASLHWLIQTPSACSVQIQASWIQTVVICGWTAISKCSSWSWNHWYQKYPQWERDAHQQWLVTCLLLPEPCCPHPLLRQSLVGIAGFNNLEFHYEVQSVM